MSDEQRMILQMVSEGKITPDEGAKLLEAIGRKKTYTSGKQTANDWGGWFGTIFSGDPFQAEFDHSPKSIPVPEETALVVKSHVGSILITGTDEKDMRVSGAPRGAYRLTRSDDQIFIKTVLPVGTLTVHVPKTITGLAVKSHIGNIVAKGLSNTLYDCEIRTHTGQIEVDTETLVAGRFNIRSHLGKINFFIPAASAVYINARCRLGGVGTDLTMDEVVERQGHLKGSLNGGGADIRLHSHMGQIFIGQKALE